MTKQHTRAGQARLYVHVGGTCPGSGVLVDREGIAFAGREASRQRVQEIFVETRAQCPDADWTGWFFGAWLASPEGDIEAELLICEMQQYPDGNHPCVSHTEEHRYAVFAGPKGWFTNVEPGCLREPGIDLAMRHPEYAAQHDAPEQLHWVDLATGQVATHLFALSGC